MPLIFFFGTNLASKKKKWKKKREEGKEKFQKEVVVGSLIPPPVLESLVDGSTLYLDFILCSSSAQPPTVAYKNGSSVGIRTCCIHIFACLAPICVLGRCLLKKISASELSRKFIKSALLVGQQKKIKYIYCPVPPSIRGGKRITYFSIKGEEEIACLSHKKKNEGCCVAVAAAAAAATAAVKEGRRRRI